MSGAQTGHRGQISRGHTCGVMSHTHLPPQHKYKYNNANTLSRPHRELSKHEIRTGKRNMHTSTRGSTHTHTAEDEVHLDTHTHTQTYTHTHTDIHTYTHTHVHTYTYTHTQTHAHTHNKKRDNRKNRQDEVASAAWTQRPALATMREEDRRNKGYRGEAFIIRVGIL